MRPEETEMRFRNSSVATAVLFAAAVAAGQVHAAPIKAAVFDFEFIDSSTEGEIDGVRADQTKRVEQTTEQVRNFLKEANVELVDVAPALDDIKHIKSLKDCTPCAQKAAQSLGADLAVVGHIQKVSNLILNINVQILDVETGKLVRGGSADIRGNTEETWTHGTKYLMKRNILKEPLPGSASK
jgi:hypothetical protein